jgi:hypothetical protein
MEYFATLLVLLEYISCTFMCLAGIATGYGLDCRGVGVRVPSREEIFLLSTSYTPVLGPIQPPIKWVPGAL